MCSRVSFSLTQQVREFAPSLASDLKLIGIDLHFVWSTWFQAEDGRRRRPPAGPALRV